jgi:hypothetical protein
VAVSGEDVYLRFITGGMNAAHSKEAYMTRIMLIALAAAGLSAPAFAEDAAQSNTGVTAATVTAELANAANSEQARVQLAHQGFTGISPLYRGEQGHWMGTAVKDGRTVIVSVLLPQAPNALTD